MSRFIEWTADVQVAAQELETEGVLPAGANTAFDTLGTINVAQLTGDAANTETNVLEAFFKLYLVMERAQAIRSAANALLVPPEPAITSITPPDYGSISPTGFATVAGNFEVELPVSASVVRGVQ